MKQKSSITTSLDDLVIKVPAESELYPLTELPITDRLRNIFAHLGLNTVSDLTPLNLAAVLDSSRLGIGTLNDLISIVERIEAGEFRRRKIENFDDLDFIRILKGIDNGISNLDSPYGEFILLRYGGVGNRHHRTLKEVGQHFDRTRQAMDIRENVALKRLRKAMGVELFDQLEYISAKCLSTIVPFDPTLFKHLLQRKRISAPAEEIFIEKSEYYLRLIGDLVPTLPVWPSGQRPIARAGIRDSIISRQLLEQLRPPCSLRELYKRAIKHSDLSDASQHEFLRSVSRSPLLRVEFLPSTTEDLSRWFTVRPGSRIDGRRKELGSQIHKILESSSEPLKIDAIHSFVVQLEGMRKRKPSFPIRSLNFYLSRKKGIYLLGPRQFGTSKHFQLTETAHRQIADAAFDILSDQRRPLSAKDLLAQPNLSWLSHPNPYEVA